MDGFLPRLQRLYLLALAVMVALAAAPLVVWGNSEDFPLLQTLLIVLIGGMCLIAVGWMRQRPIAPDDQQDYTRTFYTKAGIALMPTLAGFIVAISTGPRWLSLLAAVPAFVCLLLAKPSHEDMERHQLLYLT